MEEQEEEEGSGESFSGSDEEEDGSDYSEEEEAEDEEEQEEEEKVLATTQKYEQKSQLADIQVSETLPFDVLQVPEFQELFDIDNYDLAQKPNLFNFPDIQFQFQATVDKVKSQFTKTLALNEIVAVYQQLLMSRSNEQTLLDKLTKKDEEIIKLQSKLRRDPRLHRALILASSWRNEKYAEEKTSQACELTLNNIKGDMKDLESKVHNLQVMNSKLQKHRERNALLEDQNKRLEEILLMKDNRITDLAKEMSHIRAKDAHDQDILERAKEQKVQIVYNPECFRELEETKLRVRQRNFLLSENMKQIMELERKLDISKRAESTASHNFKNVSTCIKSLRKQFSKIEVAMQESNRRNERLLVNQNKYEKKVSILENQLRKRRQTEAGLKKLLKETTHRNEALKSQLVIMSYFERKFGEHGALKKIIRDKENENAACFKFGQRLADELKFSNMQQQEIIRKGETQQRINNHSQQIALKHKQSLAEAIIFNKSLSKRLEFTENMLKHYKSKFDACTHDTQDVLNTVRHLKTLCSEYETTMRVKDSKNDSLVVTMSHLQELLRESRVHGHNLRQMNLIAQNNHRHQTELNDMLSHLLNFTDAEKNTAFNDLNRSVNTIVILRKAQVTKLSQIAAQYKDICDLKVTISKLLQSLDIQKQETNSLRELLTTALQQEVYMKIRIKAITFERDLFGAMLIQKNVESQLLQRKTALLAIIIDRGTAKYRDLISDIRILKLEIKNLRGKLVAKKNVSVLNYDLRHELVVATRQFQLEQVKRKAMEDLKTPNYHRHMTLKNTDPSQYEKLVKIHNLQKMLISKYHALASKERIIIDKDMQLRELQILLARRPGPQFAEQVHIAKSVIVQKNRQIKGLLSEVNILTFDLNESRQKLEEVLADLKIKNEKIAKYKRLANQNPPKLKPLPLATNKQQMSLHKINKSKKEPRGKQVPVTAAKLQTKSETVMRFATSNNKFSTKSELKY